MWNLAVNWLQAALGKSLVRVYTVNSDIRDSDIRNFHLKGTNFPVRFSEILSDSNSVGYKGLLDSVPSGPLYPKLTVPHNDSLRFSSTIKDFSVRVR